MKVLKKRSENTKSTSSPPSYCLKKGSLKEDCVGPPQEEQYITLLKKSDEMVKIIPAPVYTDYRYIYPGNHTNRDGKSDSRIWFSLPIKVDVKEKTVSYYVFPYGAEEDEVEEIVFNSSIYG